MAKRTIQEYMANLTTEDAAIYTRVVERNDGYLPMIAADTRDAEIMRHLADGGGFFPVAVCANVNSEALTDEQLLAALNPPTGYGEVQS